MHYLRSLSFQEPILFQDPVYDNIALGCKGSVSKADVEQAAKLVGPTVATKVKSAKSNGYIVVTSS